MKKISAFSGRNFRVEESYSFHKHAVLLSEKLDVDSLRPLVEEYKKSFIALGDAIDEQTGITSVRYARMLTTHVGRHGVELTLILTRFPSTTLTKSSRNRQRQSKFSSKSMGY